MKKIIVFLLCSMFLIPNVFADWDVLCKDCNNDLDSCHSKLYEIKQGKNSVDMQLTDCESERNTTTEHNSQLEAQLKNLQTSLTGQLRAFSIITTIGVIVGAFTMYEFAKSMSELSGKINQQANQINQQTNQINQQTAQINQQTIQINQQTNQINQQTAQINQQTNQIAQQLARIDQQDLTITGQADYITYLDRTINGLIQGLSNIVNAA